jgi:methionyl-tRNA formyltransferase
MTDSTGTPLIFFGTPDLAVPILRALSEASYPVLAVVTQTDKPAGRGKKLSPSPVKIFAESRGIPVFQPASLKGLQRTEDGTLRGSGSSTELADFLNGCSPIAAFVVVAYGKIIPPALLDVPTRGIINVHLSLLPRWRGAAPIQRAVLNGDEYSGVSIMRIDQGLDTGPVFAEQRIAISGSDTSGTLADKLVAAGTELLLRTLPGILSGSLLPHPQSEAKVSYAEKISKEEFRIDWQGSAARIMRQIRAAAPHPGAFTGLNEEQIKIFDACPVPDKNYPISAPGTIVEVNKAELIAACGAGEYLEVLELQFPGKKRLPYKEIAKSKSLSAGIRFE